MSDHCTNLTVFSYFKTYFKTCKWWLDVWDWKDSHQKQATDIHMKNEKLRPQGAFKCQFPHFTLTTIGGLNYFADPS